MLLSKANGPEQYQIRKFISAREISSNINGSLIVGWKAIEAAKELAKEFSSFEENVNYEVSVSIYPVNIPAMDASTTEDYQVGPVI